MGDHRGGQVGAAQDRPGGPAALQHLLVDGEAELIQSLRHPVRPAVAVGPSLRGPLQQHRITVVDAVAQDMKVLVFLLHGRQLYGGDERDPLIGGGLERLIHAPHAVVVAQGQLLHVVIAAEVHRERILAAPGVDVERPGEVVGRRRLHVDHVGVGTAQDLGGAADGLGGSPARIQRHCHPGSASHAPAGQRCW